MTIQLSPSTLNLYKECPRCFWLHINEKIRRPRGIFPTLPGGMDNVIKTYFDQYRMKDMLPPEIDGMVKGKLMKDIPLLSKWRDWKTGLRFYDKEKDALLRGAIDDCLIDNNYYIPIDYKTRGYPPKIDDVKKFYGLQLDCYSLLFRENGYEVGDVAYLVFYHPKQVKSGGVVEFHVNTIEVETNIESARSIFYEAIEFLNSPVPARHSNCEYCSWLENLLEFD